MRTNRSNFATGLGTLTACGLLLVAAPTGTSEALRRPPMPCVAIGVGVYPVGAGSAPARPAQSTGTRSHADSKPQAAGPPEQHGTPDSDPDMIAHPDTAATAALGTYQERIEQDRITHMINELTLERTGAHVDATGHDTTARSTSLTRSIRRLLGHERQPTVVGGNPRARSTRHRSRRPRVNDHPEIAWWAAAGPQHGRIEQTRIIRLVNPAFTAPATGTDDNTATPPTPQGEQPR